MSPRTPPGPPKRPPGNQSPDFLGTPFAMDLAVRNGGLATLATPRRKSWLDHWFQFAERKNGTNWVQIVSISMIFGPDCAIFDEDSESGLQMAGKG